MKRIILGSIIVLSYSATMAQISISSELNAAIDAALSKSATLQNHHWEQKIQDAERKQVLRKYLPSIKLQSAVAYGQQELEIDAPTVNLPLTGIPLFAGSTKVSHNGGLWGAQVVAQQVLFSGGQIMRGQQALEAKNAGDKLMQSTAQDSVIRAVVFAFDQLHVLAEAEALLLDSEHRLDREAERVEKAITQGLAIPYDRDKITLARLNLQAKNAELRGKRTLLWKHIQVLTAYDSAQIAQISYDLQPWQSQDSTTANRNELKALEQYHKALDYRLRKDRGSYLPTLGAFATWGYGGAISPHTKFQLPFKTEQSELALNNLTLKPQWMVGAALNWDIISRGETSNAISTAKMEQKMLQNRQRETQELLDLQLTQSLSQQEILLQQILLADQQLQMAHHNLQTATKQYHLGLIGISERLQAESDVYTAALQKVEMLVQERQASLAAYAATQPLINLLNKQEK